MARDPGSSDSAPSRARSRHDQHVRSAVWDEKKLARDETDAEQTKGISMASRRSTGCQIGDLVRAVHDRETVRRTERWLAAL